MNRIDVVKANKLIDITQKLSLLLTDEEADKILLIYANACDRLEKEITKEVTTKEVIYRKNEIKVNEETNKENEETNDGYYEVKNVLLNGIKSKRGYKKMVYTTYLSKLKDIPEDAVKILIARKAPAKETMDKYNCVHALSLAPTQFLLNQYKEDNDFNKFKKIFLAEKDVVTIEENNEIKWILSLCEEKDIYLICYEKDYMKCHRSIVAQLISNKLGIDWEEAQL